MVLPTELASLAIPRLEEYFGLWAIGDEEFRRLVAEAKGLNLTIHVAASQAAGPPSPGRGVRPYERIEGVAVISIVGAMMKQESSFGGTSSVVIRRQVREAAARKDVAAILLKIDSPGGTAAGTPDLAEDVFNAAARKPVWAYIEDLGASAAYWVASQARKLFASAPTLVGSIGTYGVIADFSAAAAMEGVKVHVLRAGKFKGAGEPGTEITAEQLAEWQRRVDGINEFFLAAVSKGRRLSIERVRELADGRLQLAEDALAMGLIDGVQSFDDTLAQLVRLTKGPRKMSDENPTGTVLSAAPGPASYQEIKDACVGCDADFLCRQLEHKATLEEARKGWMAEQANRLAESQKALKTAEAKAEEARAAAAKPRSGIEPVGTRNAGTAADDADPIAAFEQLVAEHEKRGLARPKAIAKAVKEDPEAHRTYLDAYNARFGRPGLGR